MIQYEFYKAVPVTELEAELLAFARIVAGEGYDEITRMVIAVQPTLHGEPFERRWGGSDVPITKTNFESRLADPKPRKSASKPKQLRARDGADGNDEVEH